MQRANVQVGKWSFAEFTLLLRPQLCREDLSSVLNQLLWPNLLVYLRLFIIDRTDVHNGNTRPLAWCFGYYTDEKLTINKLGPTNASTYRVGVGSEYATYVDGLLVKVNVPATLPNVNASMRQCVQ